MPAHVFVSIFAIVALFAVFANLKGTELHKKMGLCYFFLVIISFFTSIAVLYLRKNLPNHELHNIAQYSLYLENVFTLYGLICVNLVLSGLNLTFRFKKAIKAMAIIALIFQFTLTISNSGTSSWLPIYYAAIWIVFFIHLLFKKNTFSSDLIKKHIFCFSSSGILLVLFIFTGASRRYFNEPFKTFFFSLFGIKLAFATAHAAIIFLLFYVVRLKIKITEENPNGQPVVVVKFKKV